MRFQLNKQIRLDGLYNTNYYSKNGIEFTPEKTGQIATNKLSVNVCGKASLKQRFPAGMKVRFST